MPGRLAVSLGMLSSTDDEPHYLPNGHALLMAMWNLFACWFCCLVRVWCLCDDVFSVFCSRFLFFFCTLAPCQKTENRTDAVLQFAPWGVWLTEYRKTEDNLPPVLTQYVGEASRSAVSALDSLNANCGCYPQTPSAPDQRTRQLRPVWTGRTNPGPGGHPGGPTGSSRNPSRGGARRGALSPVYPALFRYLQATP